MTEPPIPKNSKEQRSFDFKRYKQRHIALKILYFGWDYDGLAEQATSERTIEHHLIKALTKSCLIESRQQAKVNRCGRTDKGVSSYGQVINLKVRSNLVDEEQNVGLFTPEEYTGDTTGSSSTIKSQQVELKYVDMLNNLLPDHIRVIAWTPVKLHFSSRFNCQKRSYSYIFPMGDLCIESMDKAAKYLVGTYDFRNLCTFDLRNGVTNHVRTIYSANVKSITRTMPTTPSKEEDEDHARGASEDETKEDPYAFYELVIRGKGFLYHQIRCIMTILFLVGRKKESPEVVRDLLDVDKCPARPKYCPANPLPLTLFGCDYNADDFSGWCYSHRSLLDTFKQLKELWLRYKTRAVMIERVMFDVESLLNSAEKTEETREGTTKGDRNCWRDFGLEHDNMSDTKYVPLLRRPREESLERKLDHLGTKKRLKCD